jgi:ATP phosphoribosyltransferase
MRPLKLGIPKGSLEASTLELLAKSGWRIKSSARSYFPTIDDPDITCSLVRAQEMSRYVELGSLDCGITGTDWTAENCSDVEVVCDMVYAKASRKNVRWVLAVSADSKMSKLSDLKGKRIATELVGFTKRYFEARKIDVNVEFSWGATEAKVAAGLCDAVVEVTETGSTLKANGLKIIKDLMESNPQLIANRRAMKNENKRAKIEQIALMLQGALHAEGKVGLKLNIPKSKLKKISTLLPSITAPTVANLYGSDWMSVETVIDEKEVRNLVPKLVKAGAQGIVEYPLNKLI